MMPHDTEYPAFTWVKFRVAGLPNTATGMEDDVVVLSPR